MGSLFKARDWWQTRCGDNEEFDKQCLVVGNIDNDPQGLDKIVTGSFQGVLRLYQPKQKGYKADDLLLEQVLDGPVLQLAAGKFLSNSSHTLLAVLNPQKLVIYNVQRVGTGQDGTHDPLNRQYTLAKQYEQLLDRLAYNFVHGPFGGQAQRDHICVQTMDGKLNFFEQEKSYFTRYLSNPSSGSEKSFLLPGLLCYDVGIDSFITNTSTFEVECYRYTTFVSSSGSEDKDSEGKKLRCDWSVNVGEDVVDIQLCRFFKPSGNPVTEIVVLCDRTLFILKETGEIRQQQRLDFFPTCLTPYMLKQVGPIHNLLVGTQSASVMIYNDQKLLWSAKTNHTPVALGVATLAKLEGFIVLLSDDGHLSCNYLGTDPATQPTQLLDTTRELDYDDMDEEHRQLQQLIRQAVNAGKSEPEDHVQLQYECPSQLDDSAPSDLDVPPESGGKHCTVRLYVSYTGKDDIENAILTISVPQPFEIAQSSILVERVEGGGAPQMLPLTFSMSSDPAVACLTPTSLQAEVICCYSSPAGEPLTSRCSFFLPMSLAGCAIPPVKNPNFKITLETNLAPPPLQVLFDDVIGASAEAQSVNVFSFQYNNSSDVTILISKSANRCRIQASHFESLWLLTAELVRRMKIYYASQGGEALKIKYADSLPFQDYFQVVDTHFKARVQLAESQQKLSERAHQFRSIQKRLLVRFKDRNPSPLNNLDKLFEDTYRQLLAISEEVDRHQQALTAASNVLVCATHLILLLVQYRFDMRKEDIKIFKHYLSPIVVDSPTQGWEECTDAAMTHLLRTSLAKTYKEAMSMPQPLQVPPDTNKLKKHIALVCDRLAKGGSLRNDKPPTKDQK